MQREGPPTAVPRESTLEKAPPEIRTRKIFWLLVRLAIAGALLAYLAKSGYISPRALSRPFTAWPIALVAITLILIDIAMIAQRLIFDLRPIGLTVSFSKSFQLAMVSFFFAIFLPPAPPEATFLASTTSPRTTKRAGPRSSSSPSSSAVLACCRCS